MRNIIYCALLILFIVFVSECTTKDNSNGTSDANKVMDTQDIFFDLSQDTLPIAITGESYNFSFCELYGGYPAVTTPSDICESSADQYIPSGGNPPYHFQLDSGKGFPPMGLVLHPNGFLDGIPTTLGNSSFSVCAVDQSGKQACSETSIEVKDIRATFDSLTCEKDIERSVGSVVFYRIVAKGTAKGGYDLWYMDSVWDNMNKECTPGIDCNTEDIVTSQSKATIYSDCGKWELSTTNSCTQKNNDDAEETSWTLVYDLSPDQIPLHVTARVYINYYDIRGGTTTPVFKEVTCG